MDRMVSRSQLIEHGKQEFTYFGHVLPTMDGRKNNIGFLKLYYNIVIRYIYSIIYK